MLISGLMSLPEALHLGNPKHTFHCSPATCLMESVQEADERLLCVLSHHAVSAARQQNRNMSKAQRHPEPSDVRPNLKRGRRGVRILESRRIGQHERHARLGFWATLASQTSPPSAPPLHPLTTAASSSSPDGQRVGDRRSSPLFRVVSRREHPAWQMLTGVR